MKPPKDLPPAQARTSSPKPNSQPSPGSIGNTPGQIVPRPEPNGGIEAGKPTALTDPPAKIETPAEKGLFDKALELYEKGNIGFLEKLQKAGLDKVDVLVESSGYSLPAMVAGAIGKAVLEVFMPTNVVDLIPGGKGAGVAKKGAEAAGALKKTEKAAEAAKDVGKADNAKHAGKEDGGYVKGPSTREKGKCGEWLAKQDMGKEGFDEIVEVQNKSGHGVDLVGRNSQTGEVKVWEVKTTEGTRAPGLSKEQAELGGEKFAEDRLKRAANGKGNYGKVPEAMDNAEKAQDWLKSAEKRNAKVAYEKRDVFIDDMSKGCMKHPTRKSRSSPWTARD